MIIIGALGALLVSAAYVYLAVEVVPKSPRLGFWGRVGGVGFFGISAVSNTVFVITALSWPDTTIGTLGGTVPGFIMAVLQIVFVVAFIASGYVNRPMTGPE